MKFLIKVKHGPWVGQYFARPGQGIVRGKAFAHVYTKLPECFDKDRNILVLVP